jgi:uncharacterized YigZ family protein
MDSSVETDTYLTISKTAETVYKEKKSRFLAFVFPVESEEEVKDRLQDLRKQYYNARHHCYAYVCGESRQHVRANDDGEPNHSAGDPILGQIRAHNLTNVLVVVVRYFGGVKLGVGGLVQAYKTAAAEALAQAEIVEKIITDTLHVQFDYVRLNEVMKIVKDFELEVAEQHFDNCCTMHLRVRKKQAGVVREKLQEMLVKSPDQK